MPRHGSRCLGLLHITLTMGFPGGSEPTQHQSIPNPTVSMFWISPGAEATGQAIATIIQARPGATLRVTAGLFEIGTTLLLQHMENIRLAGAGMKEAVLSFRNRDPLEGIFANNVRGLTVRNLTIPDTIWNYCTRQGLHGESVGTSRCPRHALRPVRGRWAAPFRHRRPHPRFFALLISPVFTAAGGWLTGVAGTASCRSCRMRSRNSSASSPRFENTCLTPIFFAVSSTSHVTRLVSSTRGVSASAT